MGTARSVYFTVTSIIMIAAGAVGLAASVWITVERVNSPLSSLPLVLISGTFMGICAIMNFVSGVGGVRNYNRRINSSMIIRVPEASIFLCAVAILLAVINGSVLWHLAIILVSEIAVPAVFIHSAIKKSYL